MTLFGFNSLYFVNRTGLKLIPQNVKQLYCLYSHFNDKNGQHVKNNAKVKDVEIERIRNIGIMAHIDAGKTTTTERMLFFSGATKHLGDVDDGDTVTDYMEQERERGITITAAAITFFWNKHKINLIDTPGHVDFTLEVERSLRVLDGGITVLDASAGVEAQTRTVWRQAERYSIPRIIYLNKMDKNGANIESCLDSIIDRLHPNPLLTQISIENSGKFQGIVDLVTLRKHLWDDSTDGKTYTISQLEKSNDSSLYEKAYEYKVKLIEQLADLDEVIAHHILNDTDYNDIPAVDVMNAIRKATLSQSVIPVLCGSSFKNKGVQPLMNAVVNFLPNPNERVYPFVEYYNDSLCALAFKTVHDKQRGALTFLRLYSGIIESGSSIYNVNRERKEKVGKLYQIHADEHKEVSDASQGNIVAVTGLNETVTGDTLTASSQTTRDAQNAYMQQQGLAEDDTVPVILAGLEVPDPVFMCSIEPPSLSSVKVLDQALQCLTKEDPSLRVSVNEDTGQTVLSGMGELHLDIIKDRLLKEYGVNVYMGPLYIAYREAVTSSVEESYGLDRIIGKTRHRADISLSIHPCEEKDSFHQQKTVSIVPYKESDFDPKRLRREVLKAINSGVRSALSRGPILGFPVMNVRIEMHDFTKKYGTSLAMIGACAAICTTQALQHVHTSLLQPMMSLQIDADEDYLSNILGDLAMRHGTVSNIESHPRRRTIYANTPLSEMMQYSTALRTISSGTASFTMEVSHYQKMDEYEQLKAVEKARGGVYH